MERRALEYVGINRQADGNSSSPSRQERGMREKQRKPSSIHSSTSLIIHKNDWANKDNQTLAKN